MPQPETVAADRLTALRVARGAARRTAIELALGAGAQIIERPIYLGVLTSIRDIEPLAGMYASRQVELGARHAARDYMRESREAGNSWHQIGEALGLTPGADLDLTTVAEAAYTHAAGGPDTETVTRCGRPLVWRCQSCDGAISDHGLCNGPADDVQGHADNCPRFSAAIAAWDAEWEAGQ